MEAGGKLFVSLFFCPVHTAAIGIVPSGPALVGDSVPSDEEPWERYVPLMFIIGIVECLVSPSPWGRQRLCYPGELKPLCEAAL